ncbi:MAG TPA: nucleotidyltransferase domain-containing protein, partial [Ktedonobacterales bacterium]|nr:nucleotidyltransferase domain-containing protein [Ktedonobacterales bacterium]
MSGSTMPQKYPGNEHHQRILRAIVGYYADDERVLAVALFGSLARGNWDDDSDLDLDIVLADGVTVNPLAELTSLCDALGAISERAAVIVPNGSDAGDIVLASLLELSIRYHPLSTTSPNIVESLRVLSGSLSSEAICAAGQAQSRPAQSPLSELVDRAVRYTVE